jgi:ribonuclease HII
LFSIIIKKGAYLSTSTIDDEKPLSDHQRQEMMSMIDYARTLASWGKSTRPQTAPPKKEWVGLTDEEFEEILKELSHDPRLLAVEIEARLTEKNI